LHFAREQDILQQTVAFHNSFHGAESFLRNKYAFSPITPRLLKNTVSYHVHNRRPLDHILSQINLIHMLTANAKRALRSHQHVCLPSALFSCSHSTGIWCTFTSSCSLHALPIASLYHSNNSR
jgi:hypothetical protein